MNRAELLIATDVVIAGGRTQVVYRWSDVDVD
jgi:hypothetical protein